MKIVEFKPANTFAEAAEVLHKFETDLMDGKVAGFFIAALSADDEVTAYVSTTRPVTRLRMAGAMQHALHMFNHGDEI
jgi:hypothetical protein